MTDQIIEPPLEFMKLRTKIISITSLLLLLHSASNADTFLMKDGSEINGSIIKETYDTYLLRAEVSKNVYMEKKVLKSNVVKINKTDLSIAAYKKLSTILPTKDFMEAKDYEVIIKSQVAPFLKKHPKSPHFEDAKNMLITLKKEYTAIKNGGLKLNGKLLTTEQIEANKYDVQASMELHKFMAYTSKNQYRPALNVLSQLENNYPNTKHCRKAQKTALNILPRYQAQLQKLSDGVDALTAKRKRALASMDTNEKIRTERIFKQEEQRYQKQLDLANANKKKNKWLPINSYFKKPIESNLKMVQTETKRINTDLSKPITDPGKLYHNAYNALKLANYDEAKEHFDKFKSSKPPVELVNELEMKIKDAKVAMEKLELQRKKEEEIAKKKAAEEQARIAKEKEENENSNNKDKKGKTVIEKIEEKQKLQDILSQ